MGANLGELALLVVREPLVELLGDSKPEDAVPEELEPLVGLAPLLGPRGVGEGSLEAFLRKRVDEGEEAGVGGPLCRRATGAS